MIYDEINIGTKYFYLHDGLGTVRQILDASQNVENQYDYEGFGTSLSSTENIYNRFRYTGREYDKETESDPTAGGGAGTNDGFYFYRARTYDTTIGSFTSRDPIPALNHCPYCHANPIIYTDPLGLQQQTQPNPTVRPTPFSQKKRSQRIFFEDIGSPHTFIGSFEWHTQYEVIEDSLELVARDQDGCCRKAHIKRYIILQTQTLYAHYYQYQLMQKYRMSKAAYKCALACNIYSGIAAGASGASAVCMKKKQLLAAFWTAINSAAFWAESAMFGYLSELLEDSTAIDSPFWVRQNWVNSMKVKTTKSIYYEDYSVTLDKDCYKCAEGEGDFEIGVFGINSNRWREVDNSLSSIIRQGVTGLGTTTHMTQAQIAQDMVPGNAALDSCDADKYADDPVPEEKKLYKE